MAHGSHKAADSFWLPVDRSEPHTVMLTKCVTDAPVRMVAVSAREENPPQRPATAKGRKRIVLLHWMLLLNSGDADPGAARDVPRCHIERFFHALRQGTRMEDRRLDAADDLRRCLAFDAITALRIRNVPALLSLAKRHGFRVPRGPPDMTIAGFDVLTAGLAGFHPPKRQTLPGRRKLREGVKLLSQPVITIEAMRDWDADRSKGDEDTEFKCDGFIGPAGRPPGWPTGSLSPG